MLGWIVVIAFGVALGIYMLPLIGGAIGLAVLMAFVVIMFRFADKIGAAIREDIGDVARAIGKWWRNDKSPDPLPLPPIGEMWAKSLAAEAADRALTDPPETTDGTIPQA